MCMCVMISLHNDINSRILGDNPIDICLRSRNEKYRGWLSSNCFDRHNILGEEELPCS